MIDKYVQSLERHIRALGKKVSGFNPRYRARKARE